MITPGNCIVASAAAIWFFADMSISRYIIVELFLNDHSFQVEAALLVTQEPTHKPSSVSCCGAACRGEGWRYRIE